MAQNVPFLCECFPHVERSEIHKIVQENPGKPVDQICTMLLTMKRKLSPSISDSIDLEPALKKRKGDDEDEDDDEVQIIQTIRPPSTKDTKRRRKRKKKKKGGRLNRPLESSDRPGRSQRSEFLARIHSSRMMSVNPPSYIGDQEDREFKDQKEQVRMKKLQFENELQSVRRKQAQKWRSKGGSNVSGPSNQPMNRRGMMTLDTLPDAYDSVPTYPNLEKGRVNSIAGLNEREADPKKIGVDCLRHTNEYRRKQGLKDLKWNENLWNIGLVHSQKMGDGKTPFGHKGFNNRMQEMTRKCGARSGAENVAWTTSQQDVARETVNGWIGSPGHRKNMVSNQRFCAISVYRNSQGRFYLTQLFCR